MWWWRALVNFQTITHRPRFWSGDFFLVTALRTLGAGLGEEVVVCDYGTKGRDDGGDVWMVVLKERERNGKAGGE